MGITPVQKGQKLTAAAWNQLATTVNNITSGTAGTAAAGRVIPCTIKNRTDTARKAGELLTVYKTGSLRLAAYTPDEARAAWMNNGFQLDGWGSGTNGVPALLIDGIDEGGIGRAMVYGLCAGFITVSGNSAPDTVTFNAGSGVFAVPSSGQTGDWRVIASSTVSSGRVFAYLVPLGSGGGGSSEISFIINGGSVETKDTVKADGTYILLKNVSGHSNQVEIQGAKWILNGPTSVVTSVGCNSSGDLVVTTQQISLTYDFV